MRRRIVTVAVLAIVLVAAAAVVRATAAPDRPPGVTEDGWKPIGKELGLALSVDAGGRVHGTVMAFVGGAWRPVFVQNPSTPQPAGHR